MKLSATVGGRTHEVVVERREGRYAVIVDGVERLLDVRKLEADFYSILSEGRSYEVSVERTRDGYEVRHGAAVRLVRLSDPSREGRERLRSRGAGPEQVVASMPGKVVRVLVGPGETVAAGQGLLVLEAMKMENEIAAPRSGRVVALHVEPGAPVEAGALLAVIEPSSG
jgi:biotin carboxyl carrier protein